MVWLPCTKEPPVNRGSDSPTCSGTSMRGAGVVGRCWCCRTFIMHEVMQRGSVSARHCSTRRWALDRSGTGIPLAYGPRAGPGAAADVEELTGLGAIRVDMDRLDDAAMTSSSSMHSR